ncbi:uncharacterized protein P884DRAFT_96486 [Thermothelomyces heterothallicus CBS 202.75]|uniref:uncharacterized protein n=1 Tax=Thermothelomyces heterothallicus CBS 202.75 TaxID=1149848 RepID=UPI003742B692
MTSVASRHLVTIGKVSSTPSIRRERALILQKEGLPSRHFWREDNQDHPPTGPSFSKRSNRKHKALPEGTQNPDSCMGRTPGTRQARSFDSNSRWVPATRPVPVQAPSSGAPSSTHWFSAGRPNLQTRSPQRVKTCHSTKPAAESGRRRGRSGQNRQPKPQHTKSRQPNPSQVSPCVVALPTGTSFCFLSHRRHQPEGWAGKKGGQVTARTKYILKKPRYHLRAGRPCFRPPAEERAVLETRAGALASRRNVGQSLRGRVNAPGRDLMVLGSMTRRAIYLPRRGPRGSAGS